MRGSPDPDGPPTPPPSAPYAQLAKANKTVWPPTSSAPVFFVFVVSRRFYSWGVEVSQLGTPPSPLPRSEPDY